MPSTNQPTKPKLWVIVGATGTGKTQKALQLAHKINKQNPQNPDTHAEIINADAMQLYRGMNIGTAKLMPENQQGIPHHLIDELDPSQEAQAAWYQKKARQKIQQLLDTGKNPILVGGSGLYISSVIFKYNFAPQDTKTRQQIEQTLQTQGPQPLIEELTKLAPQTIQHIDIRNPRRLVRALEIAKLGGKIHTNLPKTPKLWQPNTTITHLQTPRKTLTKILDERVHKMWQQGLLEEAHKLQQNPTPLSKTARAAIGYAQAFAQLKGTLTQQQAIEQTQKLTRRYARRQVSWFTRAGYPPTTPQ